MKKKLLSILLMLCMIVMQLPTAALAGTTSTAAIQLGTSVLATGTNTSTAQTVWYGGQSWRVIGYGGEGVATTSYQLTLLSAGTIGTSMYNNTLNANSYATSKLKTAVESIANNFTANEKSAVIGRDLSTTEGIAGDTVSGALLWPLSTAEVNVLDSTLRVANPADTSSLSSYWWLRSPGSPAGTAADVRGTGEIWSGLNVNWLLGVRPAFNLNQNAVLFTSSAVGGKVSGTMGPSALSAVSTTPTTQWKLTLKDSSRNSFAFGTTAVNGNTLTIGYSGATPYNATTAPNEYISAIIKDSSDHITYYGHIARPTSEDGVTSVTLPDDFNSTTDKLYLISEQYNGDNKTDYASDLQEVSLTKNAYAITNNLTNLTSSNARTYRLMSETTDYTTTLTPGSSYILPSSITVNMGVSTLTAGTHYTYTGGVLTISNSNIIDDFNISAAGIAKSYTISATPTTLDFGSKSTGYTVPDTQTVTITNTGNQSVTLTQPTSTNYNLGALSKTDLAAGETASFTVQPKTGLSYGKHDETITISTNHGTSAAITAKFAVTDTTNPTAEINVNGNKWNSFFNTVTFGLFFKDTKTVAVTANDAESGVKTIEYLLSATKFNTKNDITGTWNDITSTKQFNINPNSKQFIYVRVTDNDGNVSIINTDGIILYTDPSSTATGITFTKTGTADKFTQVTLNGNTVKEIRIGSDVIDASNYTVGADGKITFKASYLDSLTAGSYNLTVSYNPMDVTYSDAVGNDAPATTSINLSIQKADGEVKNISNISKTYDGNPVSPPTYNKLGTGTARFAYKLSGADDSTYTGIEPRNAGNYIVRILIDPDNNYKEAYATANFTIAQKEVTIIGTGIQASKIYDGNNTAVIGYHGTLSANYDGSNLTIKVGTATYDSKDVGDHKTVAFSNFELAGSAKNNYKLTAQPLSINANITAKELTVNVAVKDKQYNGNNNAEFNGTPSLVGVLPGDKVALINGTPTFTSTAVANDIAINFTTFSINGAEALNYTLKQPTGIKASIKSYIAAKDIAYTVNSNDWLRGDFVVSAKSGFQVSKANTSSPVWVDTLNATDETDNGKLEFYVKNTSNGLISDKITENYKIDKTAPIINGITDKAIYCEAKTITVTDKNLNTVTLNGTAITLKDGNYIVNPAKDNQVIVATDKAGNSSTVTIKVSEGHDWNDGAVTVAPTTTTDGVKTFTCKVCGKTKTESIAKLAPKIIEGENSKWTSNTKVELSFRSNATITDFLNVTVDGKYVEPIHYTLKEGSTIVILKPEFLATLSPGEHNLGINSTTGTASTNFIIEAKTEQQNLGVSSTTGTASTSSIAETKPAVKSTNVPKTGDTNRTPLWLALFLISGGVLITLGIFKKRNKISSK